MSNSEFMAGMTLAFLSVVLYVIDHPVLALIACLPFLIMAVKYSYPQNVKKPSGHNH